MEEKTPREEKTPLAIAEKELDWYRRHKNWARVSYYGLELLVLAVGLAVTIAGVLHLDPVVPGVAGAVLVVLAGLRSLFQSRESWVARAMAEAALEKEIDFYLNRKGSYAAADRDEQLLQKAWDIRDAETDAWKSLRASPPRSAAEES